MSDWSLGIGSLVGSEPEHFFLANPIWRKPIIRLDDQTFFWPLLELFLSFGLEMLQGILGKEPYIYRKCEEAARPRFLERKVASLFTAAFPSAQVLSGSMWCDTESTAPYENDLLICLDSYLIVVESKSGKWTRPQSVAAIVLEKRSRNSSRIRRSKRIDSFVFCPRIPGRTSSRQNVALSIAATRQQQNA